jgi:hypothetical protein
MKRVTGNLTISILSFIPLNMIAAPGDTTHFKLVSAGVEVDFEGEVFTSDVKESAIQPWDGSTVAGLNLTHSVPVNSTHPLFLLLGLQFFQEVNGTQYSLKNGAFNALSIIKVNAV